MEAKARKEASNLSYLAAILRKHLSFWKKHSTKWRSLYNRQSTGHGLEPLLRDISSNGFCPITTVCQYIASANLYLFQQFNGGAPEQPIAHFPAIFLGTPSLPCPFRRQRCFMRSHCSSVNPYRFMSLFYSYF